MLKKANYNTKITELESEIPDISNLAEKTVLTALKNKIPDVSSPIKETDYNTKVTKIENKLSNHNHDKYINTSEFNTLAANVFNARIVQANLITKADFDIKLLSLNRKITQNKTKYLLVENKLTTSESKIPGVSSLVKKTDYNTKVAEIDDKFVKIKDVVTELGKSFLPYVSGNIMFDGGAGSQAFLVFQPMHKYIKTIANTKYISEWNLKDCLMKVLNLFPHLITVLHH